MLAGARLEARRHGVRLLVSDAGDNDAIQARHLDRFLEQEVNAIVVDPAGPGVVAATERAEEADVPVIAVGDVLPNQRVTTSVVSENIVAGRIAAEYLFFRMGGTGDAAEILPSRLGPAGLEMQRGFLEIADRTPTVTVVTRVTSPIGVGRAPSVASRLFESNPNLEGVFAGTDEIALSVVRAARRLGVLDRVVIVGVGGAPPTLAAIEAGRLEGSVRTDPAELGRVAVDAAVRAVRGERLPPRQFVDVTLVTHENVKRFLP
ncbi:MAG: sugar ABC transporter substrate-binding protein [Actinomycetota bacterium]|nr:sugar ABC transporter substrate-binding protein [Actinomycetota bacterium]